MTLRQACQSERHVGRSYCGTNRRSTTRNAHRHRCRQTAELLRIDIFSSEDQSNISLFPLILFTGMVRSFHMLQHIVFIKQHILKAAIDIAFGLVCKVF